MTGTSRATPTSHSSRTHTWTETRGTAREAMAITMAMVAMPVGGWTDPAPSPRSALPGVGA